MPRKRRIATGALLILAVLLVLPLRSSASDEVPRITKEALKARLGDPGLAVIDVRYDKNWKKAAQKITGAVRENPNDIGIWTGKYRKDQRLVLYCD